MGARIIGGLLLLSDERVVELWRVPPERDYGLICKAPARSVKLVLVVQRALFGFAVCAREARI
jgi:hypothetical protein